MSYEVFSFTEPLTVCNQRWFIKLSICLSVLTKWSRIFCGHSYYVCKLMYNQPSPFTRKNLAK